MPEFTDAIVAISGYFGQQWYRDIIHFLLKSTIWKNPFV
jgi:hypothetical protein